MTEISNIDTALFSKIAQGDELAFRELFEEYTPKLLRYAWDMVKSKPVAEELVQDCFLNIWAKREKLSAVDNPDGYLFIIIRNLVISHLRKTASNARVLEAAYEGMREMGNSTQETVDASESARLINMALDQLTEQKRSIFQMSRYEGLSHEQIAERLGLSKSTVKNHIVDALRHIREFLGRHTDPVVVLIIMHFLNN